MKLPDFYRSESLLMKPQKIFAALIGLALGTLYGSQAAAQIAWVKNLPVNSTKATGTSLAITLSTGGVAAGNSIIVSFAMDPASGTVSCTDSASNSYALDREHTNGSGTSGVRTLIFSAHNVTALVTNNTITCTHPSVGARAMSASEFSGLLASGAKDQATSATGSGTSPSSGNTATTTQADELLIGAIGVEGPSGDSFTPGSSYTTTVRSGTSGGNQLTNITVNPEYRIVSATAQYAATATLGTSRQWGAAIVTYKAAPAVATKLAITSINGGSNPTAGVGFSVIVQSQSGGGTPTNVVSATGVSLSLKTGTGTLGGTLTGTIAAGTNQVTISGVTYTKAESGVVITATRTSGDNLTAGDSAAFTVNPGSATQLAFTTQPGASNPGTPIPGPPIVAVKDSLGNTVTSSSASITMAIGSNPGGGTLSGTTTKNASSGVASFTDLSINQNGDGYTLVATSSGLTGATSTNFDIIPPAVNIALVRTLPTNSSKASGTSIAVTLPAGTTVAAGNSLIVSLAMDPATGTVSCTDSASNSYAVDQSIANGSGTSGVRTVILSAHNVNALASGSTITCTHPSLAARVISVSEFSGLSASSAKDQATGATGSGTSPSSGNTATTTQAVELLFGAIGVEGPSGDTFTPGANYSAPAGSRVSTSGGNATTNITVNPEYRIVNTTAAYAATGSMGSSRQWAAAIATYKAKVIATKLTITSVNGGTTPTVGQAFSLVVRSQKGDGTPAPVVNPTGFNLSVASGAGNLSAGTTSGTIAAGSYQVTVSGVKYSKADIGVVLRATQTSGDPVTPGDSAPFSVNANNATTLAFIFQAANSTTSGAIKGPPTVAVRDDQGNTITNSTAPITIAIGTNPGGGTLSGTTVKNAVAGVVGFGDLHINNAANGYTLTATSPGLTSATTNTFNITAAGSVAGTVTKAAGGGAINGALA
jgi:hypothetical protein